MADPTRHISITRSVDSPYDFPIPSVPGEYVLLLVIAATEISSAEQDAISRKIVSSGCRYALAFGDDCPIWEDSIDRACIEIDADDAPFIMTTSHEEEEIEDVIDFLWLNTAYGDFEPEHFVIHILGHDPDLEARLRLRLAHHQHRE